MKVLIACEFSGIVRDAFIKIEHDVISCDLLPTEKQGPHYQGYIMKLQDQTDKRIEAEHIPGLPGQWLNN